MTSFAAWTSRLMIVSDIEVDFPEGWPSRCQAFLMSCSCSAQFTGEIGSKRKHLGSGSSRQSTPYPLFKFILA